MNTLCLVWMILSLLLCLALLGVAYAGKAIDLTCLTTSHLQVGTVNITGTEVSLATVTLMETPGLRQLRLDIRQDRLTSAMEHAEIIHDPGYIAAQQQAGTEARRDEEEGEGMEVDPAFSDSIRHVMDGGLPDSLKHIISNAEYYGPPQW